MKDEKFEEIIKKMKSAENEHEKFEYSIELARCVGVDEQEIIKTADEGDDLFTK